MSCKGLHCDGCGNGGPGIAVLAVILISAMVLGTISRSMHTIDRIASDVITVLTIITFSMVGIAFISVAGIIIYKIRKVRIENSINQTVINNKTHGQIENKKTIYVPSQTTVVRSKNNV